MRASTKVPGVPLDLGEGELLGPPDAAVLDQQAADATLLGGEVGGERGGALFAEAGGAFVDQPAVELRHARRGRSRPRREREDVEMGQAAFLDDRERAFGHRLGLGGEAGDEVGAEDRRPAGGGGPVR